MRNLLLFLTVILLLTNCSSNHQEAPSENAFKESNNSEYNQENDAFGDLTTEVIKQMKYKKKPTFPLPQLKYLL